MEIPELSNAQIVTIAVYLLNGAVSPVDMEDIAMQSSVLAHNRFGWKKFPEQIDLRIIHYSLQAACKEDSGLLKGDAKQGYMLTKSGLDWASSHLPEFNRVATSPRKLSLDDLIIKERIRLENTKAYTKYQIGELSQITIIDFREFSRVNDYFPDRLRKQRYSKIDNVVRGDEKLEQVWNFLKETFKER